MRWSLKIACLVYAALSAFQSPCAETDKFDPTKLPPPSTDKFDFHADILPLLTKSCVNCHGPEKQKSELRVDSLAALLKGGQEGPSIIPGKSAESRLIRYVSYLDPETKMPPKDKGEKFTDKQVGLLRAWIDQGAVWPGSEAVKADAKLDHWAYKKPVSPTLPSVKNASWVKNPIDSFILARLEKENLAPSPEAPKAPKAILLRRLYLDLIGLPPSPEEVDAFVADTAPDAYDKTVDRLLANPHYGERWARPWLDAARYGDTHGYEKDPARSIWPWRDWVINAFNKNMSFKEFTIEQIAGDLLPNPTPSQMVATGFHRNSLINDEGGVDHEEFRMAALNDRVETTAMVWLGLTMNCAQCHTHKFDPISHKEYYQFMAYFNSTEENGANANPDMPVPTAEQEKQLAEIRSKMNGADKPTLDALQKQEKEIYSKAPKTLITRELPKPRPTTIALRGNFRTPGDPVTPNVPAFLNPLPKDAPPNRLTLAKWLVDENNPLTARVTVNRFWALIYGNPLVDTVEDFGVRGEKPTHPELLDWLACEFMRTGWDMKALVKLLVTSATYRQSSIASKESLERDLFNRLLARGPRFRVEGEMVRDLALAESGRLSDTIGGPSVYPPQPPGIWENSFGFQSFAGNQRYKADEGPNRYRRAMYTYWRRTAPYPSLQTFDLVSRDVCKVKRSRTNTPLQALNTLNDPIFVECSAGLGKRMADLKATKPEERIVFGFRVCMTRAPKDGVIARLYSLYTDALATFSKEPAKALALIKEGRVEAGANPNELAAWITVANVLQNLDEAFTKY